MNIPAVSLPCALNLVLNMRLAIDHLYLLDGIVKVVDGVFVSDQGFTRELVLGFGHLSLLSPTTTDRRQSNTYLIVSLLLC